MGSHSSKGKADKPGTRHDHQRPTPRPSNIGDDELYPALAKLQLNNRDNAHRTRPQPPSPPRKDPPSFPVPHVEPPSPRRPFVPPPPPPPLNAPLQMPEPQPFKHSLGQDSSRTMHYALQHPVLADFPMAPYGTHPPLQARAASWSPPKTTSLTPAPPAQSHQPASAPVTPPIEDDEPARCHGTNKQGARCGRRARKADKADIIANANNPDYIPYLCYQHTSNVLDNKKGFYSTRKDEIWKETNHQDTGYVEFKDWIPSYLSNATAIAIRDFMTKSMEDEDGYIYAFEIRSPSELDLISIKVGRSVNVIKRLDEWDKQCRSKDQVFRGYWPSARSIDEDAADFTNGRLAPGPKGRNIRRLERLVHLHLADVVMYMQFSHPKFPDVPFEDIHEVESDSSGAEPSESPKGKGKGKGKAEKKKGGPSGSRTPLEEIRAQEKKCHDCGKTHMEIFNLIRPAGGEFEGKEYEFVREIIEHWGRFVTKYC